MINSQTELLVATDK